MTTRRFQGCNLTRKFTRSSQTRLCAFKMHTSYIWTPNLISLPFLKQAMSSSKFNPAVFAASHLFPSSSTRFAQLRRRLLSQRLDLRSALLTPNSLATAVPQSDISFCIWNPFPFLVKFPICHPVHAVPLLVPFLANPWRLCYLESQNCRQTTTRNRTLIT